MKAAICYGPGKPLVIEDGVTLDPPGKDEVKVKIAVTAICHSDLHFFSGDIPFPPPGLAGHEIAGHIDEVGEGVAEFKPGDVVIVGTVTSGCGHCYYCTKGLPHLCSNKPPFPLHHTNKAGQKLTPLAGGPGGFVEYTTVSKYYVTKIPEEMPIEQASLLACGVTSGFGAVVNRAGVRAMESVVVIGAGGVGMNSLQGAAFSGAYPVIAVDIVDSKLETAREFGATHTINSVTDADPIKSVMDLTGGRGADYVFVTVGNIKALRQGFLMSRPRGMTVAIGLMNGNLAEFDPFELLSERIITGAGGGSLRLSLDIPFLCDLYLNGKLKLDELITARYPLEQINEAIEPVIQGKALRNLILY